MIGNEIREAFRRPAFDLTASLRSKQHDPCWFMPVEPQSHELEGRIKNNIRRGDVRNYFARNVLRFVGGRS